MTTDQRVAALQALYSQLDALLTPEEAQLYPTLIHLGDLVTDLKLELQRQEE
jgi:hypothetical protein